MAVPVIVRSEKKSGRGQVLLVAVLSFVLGHLLANNTSHEYYGCTTATSSESQDLLPHLPDCHLPQSPLSLPELAEKYKPSKFWGYAHTNFDRFYPDYLEKYRTKKFRFLEIGLDSGSGSLLWKDYFPCADLVGLEYVQGKERLGESVITTIYGDQGDAEFLKNDFLKQAKVGNNNNNGFDVIIDDGGHHYEQQRTSYEVLFEHALNPSGLYIMEDVETSYWKKGTDLYGKPVTRGGVGEPKTIVNEFKKLVDVVNKKFYDNSYTVFGAMDQLVATMTFASNLIILKKKDRKNHCFAERRYIWPGRLADDCPARDNSAPKKDGSLVHKMCGDAIFEGDKLNSRPGTK